MSNPDDDVLTPEEAARCEAMSERADHHAAEGEGFAKQLAALRARDEDTRDAIAEALCLVLAIHICNRARCEALGCSAPTLEETLDRHKIIAASVLNQSLDSLKGQLT